MSFLPRHLQLIQYKRAGVQLYDMGNDFAMCGGGERKSDTDANGKLGKAPTKYAEESKDEPKHGRRAHTRGFKRQGWRRKEQEGNRFITDKDL